MGINFKDISASGLGGLGESFGEGLEQELTPQTNATARFAGKTIGKRRSDALTCPSGQELDASGTHCIGLEKTDGQTSSMVPVDVGPKPQTVTPVTPGLTFAGWLQADPWRMVAVGSLAALVLGAIGFAIHAKNMKKGGLAGDLPEGPAAGEDDFAGVGLVKRKRSEAKKRKTAVKGK